MKTTKQYLKEHLYSKLYENNNEDLGKSIRDHRRYISNHPYVMDGVIKSDNRISDGQDHHHMLHAASLLATSAHDAFGEGHIDVARNLHNLSVEMVHKLPEHIRDGDRYVEHMIPNNG
jgi:hypothetical protein